MSDKLIMEFLRDLEAKGGSSTSYRLSSSACRMVDRARQTARRKGYVTFSEGRWRLLNAGAALLKDTSGG